MKQITRADLESAARRLWNAEIYKISHSVWSDSTKQVVAAHRAKLAYDGVMALLKTLDGLPTTEKTAVLRDLYEQAYVQCAGYLVNKTQGADARVAMLDDATDACQEKWQEYTQTLDATPDEKWEDVYREVQQQLTDAVAFLRDITLANGSALLNWYRVNVSPKVNAIAKAKYDTLYRLLPKRLQRTVVQEIVDGVVDPPPSGGPPKSLTKLPLKWRVAGGVFGFALIAISVGLAVWDGVDDQQHAGVKVVENLASLGVGTAGALITGSVVSSAIKAVAGKIEAGIMEMSGGMLIVSLGIEQSILAGLFTAGIGTVVSLVASALFELLFELFTGDPTPTFAVAAVLAARLDAPLRSGLVQSLSVDLSTPVS